MRIEADRKLFVGVRIDNKLREALDHCAPRDKALFDGSDPRYLTILRDAEHSYVGRLIDGGMNAPALDDLKRNVISLLARLQGRRSEDHVRLYAVDPGDPPPVVPKEPREPGDRY